jgi:isoleucyl-tRNA synthetase
LAPYTPFLAEYIFQLLRHPFANQLPESIHLCSISETKELTITNEVLESFDKYKSLVESGRLLRNQAGIKFRQPLSAAYIEGKSPFPKKELKVQFLRALKHELNVKEIRFTNELTSDLLENQENVSHESVETNLKLYLITEINSELKQEGIAREIVRAIQQLRKEADLNWNSRIKVLYQTQARELSESLQNFEDYVKRETLSLCIQSEQTESSRDFIINNAQLKLAIEVISH